MSYDLNLWKQNREIKKEAADIYHRLCEGKSVEGLESLPIDQLLKRIHEDFPGVEQSQQTLDWEAPKDKGAFQVYWSPQWMRFDCYRLSVKYMRLLITLARDFNIPIYDPQRNHRYETFATGKEKPPED